MRSGFYRDCLISLALALATAATFRGAMANGFANFDDDLYVYNNSAVKQGLARPSIRWAFTNTEAANWHPLTWLSLETDYQWFGLNPAGFHATNVVLHVGNTLLLFWLLRVMTGAALASACAAALLRFVRCTSSRSLGSRSARTCCPHLSSC